MAATNLVPEVRMEPRDNFAAKMAMSAALPNVIINPVVAWAANHSMKPVAAGDVAVDTIATCLILSVIVAWFMSAATRHALAAATVIPMAAPDRHRVFEYLPRHWFPLGLLLGAAAATILATILMTPLYLSGVTSVSFIDFALTKLVYTPALAYAVARIVIQRQFADLSISAARRSQRWSNRTDAREGGKL